MSEIHPGWVDSFLFFDALLVFALIFIDWLLGETRRVHIRESLESLWIKINDIAYSTILAKDARRSLVFLEKLFDIGWFSKRRMLLSLLTTSVLVLVPLYITIFDPSAVYAKSPNINASITAQILFPSAILFWFSLSVSISFLKVISKQEKFILPLIFVLIDLIIACAIFLVCQTWQYFVFYFNIGTGGTTIYIPYELGILSLVTLVFSMAPSLVHILYSTTTLFLKVFRGVIRGPINLVVFRITESRQGVLTQLALGIGSMAKIVQEFVKHVS